MFLIDSNKYASDPQGSIGEVTKILERVNAKTLAARPWLDGKLAYLVEGRRKGLHYLVYMEMEGQNLEEMTRLCKLNDTVLRHLVIKLDPSLVEPMLAVVSGETPQVQSASDDADNEDDKEDNDDDEEEDDELAVGVGEESES